MELFSLMKRFPVIRGFTFMGLIKRVFSFWGKYSLCLDFTVFSMKAKVISEVHLLSKTLLKNGYSRGACAAQSVKQLTSAQVLILRFVGSSPALGSGRTAWSLESASDSVSPSLLPLPRSCSVSLSLSNINKH